MDDMKRDDLFSKLGHSEPLPPTGENKPHGRLPSPFRDYVIEDLPLDLARRSSGQMDYGQLREKHIRLVNDAAVACESISDLPSARVVQLDLLFMLGAFAPIGPESFPAPLVRLISAQSSRFPELDPHLSYELLIDVNCEQYESCGDIRVFSAGELATYERDFYLGHYLSEPLARTAAENLRAVVEQPGAANSAALLQEAAHCLDEFRLFMAAYSKLPVDAFNEFRRYHAGYPGGPRGASGAFMPSVQLVELALLPPTKLYDVFLDDALEYFPFWSRPVISEWRDSSTCGRNVSQLFNEGLIGLDDTDMAEALLKVIDKLADFRMVHLGITRKAIPEAFTKSAAPTRRNIMEQGGELPLSDGDVMGTSGFSARNLLTNSVYRLLELRQDVAARTRAQSGTKGGL